MNFQTKRKTHLKLNLLLFTAFLVICSYQSNAQEKIVPCVDLKNNRGTGKMNYEGEPYSGTCQDFHPNGKIAFIGSLKDGLPHGIGSFYYSDGKIKARKNYLEGKLNGYSEEYLKNGDLVKTNYYDGNSTSVFTLTGGAENNKFDLKESTDEKEQKTVVGYWQLEAGQDSTGKESHLVKGKLYTGAVKVYNKNGTLFIDGNMKSGKKNGLWVQNNISGNLISKETFKSGEKDGVSEEYHYDGKLSKREFWKKVLMPSEKLKNIWSAI